jgi:hypothetical protein
MADDYVQVYPDSGGKKVAAQVVVRRDGTVVEQQEMVVADWTDFLSRNMRQIAEINLVMTRDLLVNENRRQHERVELSDRRGRYDRGYR